MLQIPLCTVGWPYESRGFLMHFLLSAAHFSKSPNIQRKLAQIDKIFCALHSPFYANQDFPLSCFKTPLSARVPKIIYIALKYSNCGPIFLPCS